MVLKCRGLDPMFFLRLSENSERIRSGKLRTRHPEIFPWGFREAERRFDFARCLATPFELSNAEAQILPMSERFLIVDDDADSTFLARRNLQTVFPDAAVEHVASGQAALELLRQHDFTAVITDYRMPWMDGLTLVRKIRELNLHMPIVMRTAMEDLENAARAAGVDYVLPWFRWRELGEVVKELLHCHTSGSDSHA
jgi:two-component system, chemotaxis family, chemotaxis protein CheY